MPPLPLPGTVPPRWAYVLFGMMLFAVVGVVGYALDVFAKAAFPEGWENYLFGFMAILVLWSVDYRIKKLERSVKDLAAEVENLKQQLGH